MSLARLRSAADRPTSDNSYGSLRDFHPQTPRASGTQNRLNYLVAGYGNRKEKGSQMKAFQPEASSTANASAILWDVCSEPGSLETYEV